VKRVVQLLALLGACAAPRAPIAPALPPTGATSAAPAPPPVAAVEPQPTPAPPDPLAQALVFDLPEPALEGRSALSLWATYYYIPRVEQRDDGFELRTMGDVALARLAHRDWCEVAMQGTVQVTQPGGALLTINFDGTRDNVEVDCKPVYPKHGAIGRSRFRLATGPWGDGTRGMVLVPFRSLAVDPRTIPDGSLVYIPAARGTALTLPDGRTAVHDGYFFSADRGGAIKDEHIDVFVGVGPNPFAFVKSKRKATFDAYVLGDAPEAGERLGRAHHAFARRDTDRR
jgi:3D (Asp-Asp-Asp) domain-containing protein